MVGSLHTPPVTSFPTLKAHVRQPDHLDPSEAVPPLLQVLGAFLQPTATLAGVDGRRFRGFRWRLTWMSEGLVLRGGEKSNFSKRF